MAQPVSVCHQWSMTGMPSSSPPTGRSPGRAARRPGTGTAGRPGRTWRPARRRVFLLDGAERGRRGEQRLDTCSATTRQNAPASGVPDRLALVQHGGAPGQQRGVHDIGMPDHPAHVGGGPEHVARAHVVDVGHAPAQRHRVPAVVPDHALGPGGGAGRVQDVQRVGGCDRDAGAGAAVAITAAQSRSRPGGQVRGPAGAARSRSVIGLVGGQLPAPGPASACRARSGRPRCRTTPRPRLWVWRRRCARPARRRAKPPNTTEWMAPSRAHASMAIAASGIIGM